MPDLLHDDEAPAELVSTQTVYEGRVWDMRRDTFLLDGHEITRDYVDHSGAVAVLALDERDRMLVIKQYRHPVRLRDWELPAGLLDIEGEPALLAAQRELAEEADLVAEHWSLLTDILTSPGGSNEAIRVFLARGVSAAPTIHARTEEEAGIEVRWVPLDDVVDSVLARTVQNSILAIAALAAAAGRARGWETLGAADAPWAGHQQS
ncbi:NUDIX hydrolase [soil metagenome]